jgi:hypothetical protein
MVLLKSVERQWFLTCTAAYAVFMSGGSAFAQQGSGDTVEVALGGIANKLDDYRLLWVWGALAGIGACVFAGAALMLQNKKWFWGSFGCIAGAAIWYGAGDTIMSWIPQGRRIAQGH